MERNERTGKQTDYLYLSGSLVAQVNGAAAPSVPVLTAPGYITQGSVNLTWTPAGGANRYELKQLSGGSWGALYGGTAMAYTAVGLQTGTFQYRVRGCREVCGDWSNTATVAVELPPGDVPALSLVGTTDDHDIARSSGAKIDSCVARPDGKVVWCDQAGWRKAGAASGADKVYAASVEKVLQVVWARRRSCLGYREHRRLCGNS